jgi:hypothetical protein
MSDNQNANAMGSALAGGAIAAAVLERLFDKGIFTLDESRAILQSAMKSIAPVIQSPEGLFAYRLIGDLQRGKFSARGQNK